MNLRNILYTATIASLTITATLFGLLGFMFITEAQVEPNSRYFQKDFCEAERDTLNGINYSNGQELSYGESGCPVSQIVISNWDNISVANRLIITNRLAVDGYNDVTAQIQALGL